MLWQVWPFLSPMSFKLPRTSTSGGQLLVQNPLIHQPVPRAEDERYNINSILKVDGTMGNLPVQFFDLIQEQQFLWYATGHLTMIITTK